MRVIVAGGGIGGLCLALQLHHRGIDALVCESVRDPQPLGVGIMIHPAAMREFDTLGLSDEVLRLGREIASERYMSPDGAEILRRPAGRAAGYRWPAVGVHRGRLQMMLLERARLRLGPENVRTGLRLERWNFDGGDLQVSFRKRETLLEETIPADLLVGADGTRSTCRQILFPHEAAPRWSGRLLYRGVTATPAPLAGPERVLVGDGERRLAMFPIGEGTDGLAPVHWMLDLRAPDGEELRRIGWNARAELSDLLPYVSDWTMPLLHAPRLLMGAERIFVYPRIDRDPLPCWSFGPVTLLGDAAHPAHPAGANAATQAVLDGAALAEALVACGDPVAACRAYEARRRPDTARIALANRSDGPERLLERHARHVAAGETPPPRREMDEIAENYLRLAGLDPATVNDGALIDHGAQRNN